MADKKISELTALTAPDGAEELVVNDSGTSKKITIDNLITGIDDNATSTAITIDASENVGIGQPSPSAILETYTASGGTDIGANHGSGGTYPKASGISFGQKTTSRSVSNNGGTTVFSGGAGIYSSNTAASGNPTNLVMWANASGTPSDRLTIKAAGGAVLHDGNLVIGTSGQGLDFDTAGSGNANLLDDYEEGTWTPAASGGASSASGTYTKVGRLVICNGILNFPTQTNSGHATVEGLPFTSLNDGPGFTGSIRYTNYDPKQLMMHGNPNATTFGLYEVNYGTNVSQVSWTEISGKRLDFSLMYFV